MLTIDHVWAPHRFLKIQVITYLQGEGKEREGEDIRGRRKGEGREQEG